MQPLFILKATKKHGVSMEFWVDQTGMKSLFILKITNILLHAWTVIWDPLNGHTSLTLQWPTWPTGATYP